MKLSLWPDWLWEDSVFSHHAAKCVVHNWQKEEEAKSLGDAPWLTALFSFYTTGIWRALILLVLHTIWGYTGAMWTFFQLKKRKFVNWKKKIDWIHFGSVFYKQHKAYLSSLLTQKHICVEVFCFSFFTGRLISKPSDFVIFQFPSFLPLDNQFLTNSSFLHSFIHFINSINIYWAVLCARHNDRYWGLGEKQIR